MPDTVSSPPALPKLPQAPQQGTQTLPPPVPPLPLKSTPPAPPAGAPPLPQPPLVAPPTSVSPPPSLTKPLPPPPASNSAQSPASLPGLPKAPAMPVPPPLSSTSSSQPSQPSLPPSNLPPSKLGQNPLPPPPAATKPTPPEFKKSPLRFLPFILGGLLLLGLALFIFSRFNNSRTTTSVRPSTTTGNRTATGAATPGAVGSTRAQTVITYWGLWEPTPVLQQVLANFERENPDIKVNYQQQTSKDYRERLQTAIAAGRGPDVFRFHASWVPMLRSELSEVPATVYSATEYQSTFYPIAEQQLKLNNRYVGIPLMYDGLALMYNKEILRTANAQPPTTWTELKTLANRLTLRNGTRIQRAGLAIGNATNVDHFGDILGLLMLQNGADPAAATSQQVLEALQYYTDFYTKDKVWDDQLPRSTTAFSRGEVAMILAPSWRIHEIAAANPNISIGVAPVPQLGSTKVNWASYWAEGVSAQSKQKDAAWRLLKYLSSREGLQTLYSDASKERSFGALYPRVDMANDLAQNEYVAPYLLDAPNARNWYLNTATHDNGVNDQILKYYENGITAITTGRETPKSALTTIDQGVRQVLRQYGISATTP